MEDIIKLHSRYGENNYLERIEDYKEPNAYVLKTDHITLRVGLLENGNKFIDPSGGPMIVEYYLLEEANAYVKSIDFIEGIGWVIILVESL